MRTSLVALAIAAFQGLTVAAQTVLHEHIWSTIIYSRYGDRTPYILPTANTLTPLGANQMYSAGNRFRDRYLAGTPGNGNTIIQGISPFQLNNDQVSIVSLTDQFVVASAQAFMQGLYPPLQASSNATFINGQSQLANGSNVLSPLDGYQYPQIDTASPLDLNSIWLEGANNCPIYSTSRSDYFNSPAYANLLTTTRDFYHGLQPALLNGIFVNSSVNYLNAYLIFDYLNYGSIHNSSFGNNLSLEDLTRAKLLADNWMWAVYGNTSASGLNPGDHIRAIAGRTIANRIVQSLYANINTQGAFDKLTLLFGGFEPMISFAALAGLASDQNPQFSGVPEYGSSMVFELYSLAQNDTGNEYPSTTDLNVRFFFMNGTSDSAELVAYPLFGNGPSGIAMTFSDFVAGMQKFMILSAGDWCETCASYSIFCPALRGGGSNGSPGSRGGSKKALSPVVGGVIGAVVTMAVLGLVIAVAMLFGGIRLYRQRTKRRSELNGFKGGEKLASDQDLTIPKGGAGASVTAAGVPPAKGHERVGSWELGEQSKAKEAQLPDLKAPATPGRRPSFEEDDLHVSPFADPVKPNDRV
jgi:Histidine phosphatase superfamily (branch 2)